MEQIVGGEWHHGDVAYRTDGGHEYLACGTCRRPVFSGRWGSHQARHKRLLAVYRASLDMNQRGVNFQTGQSVGYTKRRRRTKT